MARRCGTYLLALILANCAGCSSQGTRPSTPVSTGTSADPAALGAYTLIGDTTPVRDPGMMHQGSTYYVFSTDPAPAAAGGLLAIRCSEDTVTWSECGHIFSAMPSWVSSAVPAAINLWAPDISYFNGLYHVYYAASSLVSQVSAIGEATNATLDPSSPDYKWVDHGEVIASRTGDNFNAIDPSILVDADGSVWMTYGSFWTGIKQQRIDSSTGLLSTTDGTVYSLAGRTAAQDHAVEGASLVQYGSYYYLFLSTGHCCRLDLAQDDYAQIVGRASGPHGPFLDRAGTDLEDGGGTVLLEANALWSAPGGGSAYLDAATGQSLLVFHAARVSEAGAPYLWVKKISWQDGWPSLN